jgi:hypothetical protein
MSDQATADDVGQEPALPAVIQVMEDGILRDATPEEIAEIEARQAAVLQPTRRITCLAFRNRFTADEKVMIELAAADNPNAALEDRKQAARLRANMADVAAASFIDLDRPDTRAGVHLLEAAGVIDTGRALQILDAEVQPNERPVGL